MSKAVAARQGTMGQFLFTGLPGKGQPIDGRLLLSFGSERTTAGAAMGRVFSRYVALTVAAHHWTPTGGGGRQKRRVEGAEPLQRRSARHESAFFAFGQLDRKIVEPLG